MHGRARVVPSQGLLFNLCMKSNLSFYIGIRYALSKRNEGFLSFISGFSFAAMAIGVMTLIVVLSVMNGFDREIKQRLLNVVPHITIKHNNSISPQQINQLSKQLKTSDQRINAVTPILEDYAMLANRSRQQAVLLKGIDALWPSAKLLSDSLLIGDVSKLQPREYGILLGRQAARRLGVDIGDSIEVILPKLSVTPVGTFPRLKMMVVIGIFEVGAQVDATTAYIHERDARKLFQLGDNYQGLQLALDDPFQAQAVVNSIVPDLPDTMQLETWSEQMATLFQAMRMEKLVVGLLLSVIIAVAAFNIVACLLLMVADKRKDIAVLRTLGARSDQIVKIFIIQGSAIGLVGVVLGLFLGCLVALFIGDIVSFFEGLTNSHMFNPAVYMISSLPSKLVFTDILLVVIGASVISVLATIYPAWRAGQVLPAEALRYDQ
ncbi:MAG: lipoprotein-releasing ABC transporter permease subunit [Porticoccaceae bacterium]|nr:lipoprotein-releasing ABC transporter permease subunit [Porticoccaceae bacterium]